MNYGFLIDNRKCIGCHACTTACKQENEVPLGVNRTWVKYVEKGVFPDTRRYFQVTRCNHCANPPCVHICPTGAMFQRADGIVEFDGTICIGCKACLQACPYDAIYIDPETHTAAKCHFCAHRIEIGLEPSCVIVCPEHAILAGDLDDPQSEIARTIATHQVRVRKPEQGTQPKLFYIDAEESSITPMLARQDADMLWAGLPQPGAGGYDDWRGPIQLVTEGKMAGALLNSAAPRETYNVPHRIPWHWPVPAYLVTKAISAGAFIVGAGGVALGLLPDAPLFTSIAAFIALLFIGITTLLLIADLDQPRRFWYMLKRPQWRSWLTRGAFILIGYSALLGLYFLGHAGQQLGLLPGASGLSSALMVPAVVLAVLAAVYTAFLFAQAEGRDLWQSPLLAPHLLVQAVMAGAAALLIVSAFIPVDAQARSVLAVVFGMSVLANGAMIAFGEFGAPHASAVASVAAHLIKHGKYARDYWIALVVGTALPLLIALALPASPLMMAIAALAALFGLYRYEYAFVMAPQEVPNN
ncbi:MAG: NrfD/PsrC family molybdoenzyme membrane anchor subunit [Candidatus Brachytrichaceae bacterium NZ_4S206]|jgi:Fe-S-cluster-containing dehydrogenase component/formate-dependent nitrite reductase membrane component NrfD